MVNWGEVWGMWGIFAAIYVLTLVVGVCVYLIFKVTKDPDANSRR